MPYAPLGLAVEICAESCVLPPPASAKTAINVTFSFSSKELNKRFARNISSNAFAASSAIGNLSFLNTRTKRLVSSEILSAGLASHSCSDSISPSSSIASKLFKISKYSSEALIKSFKSSSSLARVDSNFSILVLH